MKIFITGATGYIGHHLAIELVLQGHKVIALARSAHKAKSLAAAGVQCVIGDLQSKAAIEEGMKGCDAVFHLAAYASVWPDEEDLFQDINVEGTRTVLAAAVKSNVPKVVITSTAGVYGPSATTPVCETTVRSAPYFTAYEATKARAEDIARAYAKEGLHVVIVNPARVYGPGRASESNAIGRLIRLYLAGKWYFIPGDGQRTGSYSFIDDVVQGHIRALAYGRSGENYLFGGENISYEKFFRLLQLVSKKNRRLYKIPVPVMVNASTLMVLWARMTNTKPLITPRWAKKYMFDWSVSSQKAVNELGYSITPFEKGLKKTLNRL